MATGRIDVVIRAAAGFTNLQARRLILDVHANLVRAPSEGGTPVLTGWARANWIPSIGARREGVVGSPKSVSQAVAQAAVTRIATGYRLEQGPVHITNNVPYIQKLNDGYSPQAPAGFVQRAIFDAVQRQGSL